MKKHLKGVLTHARSKNTSDLHPEFGNYHHFTYIIQEGLLSWATNKIGSGQEYLFGYGSTQKLHSEPAAYKKAKGILSKNNTFTCVNIRLNRLGDLRNSEPCAICKEFLKNRGCNIIYYTTNENKFKKQYI